jgi:hypothetical protein
VELPGDLLQVAAGLLRRIADHLEEALAERVLLLQAEKEVDVLQAGIGLLQAAQNVVVRGVGVLGPGQVAGVVEQVTRPGERLTQTVSPGSPFVPGPALLPAGSTTSFRLTFQRKGSGTITFNPIVLAGYTQP